MSNKNIIQFGTGYELKNISVKTSTKEARALFLNLIGELRPNVTFDLLRLYNLEDIPNDVKDSQSNIELLERNILQKIFEQDFFANGLSKVFDTPLLNFFDYLFRNYKKFERAKIKGERFYKGNTVLPETIQDYALEKLIPSWQRLMVDKSAGNLCVAINNWAKDWGLTEDWCKEFALSVLGRAWIKLNEDKSIYTTDNLLLLNSNFYDFNEWLGRKAAWNSALHEESWKRFAIDWYYYMKSDNHPTFEYKWRGIDIQDIWYPTVSSNEKQFTEKMELEFWSQFFTVGTNQPKSLVSKMPEILCQLELFTNKIQTYLSDVKRYNKKNISKTQVKQSGDTHFRWLVEYQIPSIKNQSRKSRNEIAKTNSVDRKAVARAIMAVSKLLNLTPRPFQETGRKFSNTTSKKRRRAQK